MPLIPVSRSAATPETAAAQEDTGAIINSGFISAIEGNAGIFLFLVLLGIIVALVNASGGSAAFGRWAEKNIKSRVGIPSGPLFS